MKRFSIVVSVLIVCAFGMFSCAAPPREAIIRDPGPYPEEYRAMIRWYLDETLEKPDSIRDFEILKSPEIQRLETYYAFIPLHEGQKVWEVFIAFDAKDRSGRYRGRDMHVVWIRHNRLVAFDYERPEVDFVVRQRRPGGYPGEEE